MKAMNTGQLVDIIHGDLIAGDVNLFFDGVSIDSRTIQHGQAFFAILGENFDGHDYATSAIAKGACCIVIEHEVDLPAEFNAVVIRVKNSVTALGQLAAWYRQQLSGRVIAVTGSVGKTTSRGILYQILSHFFKCRQAHGSFNNHIGVPLTLLSADPNDEILLVEIGSNHLGEIERLSAIANPNVAVITIVADSHLSGFGTLDNIVKEKASIAQGLQEGGTLYLNGDQPELLNYVTEHFNLPIITFGESQTCTVRGSDLETTGTEGSLVIEGQCVKVPLAGKANLSNVLIAWSVCRDLGISLSDFTKAVKTLKPENMRLEIETIGSLTVINDCYNANPISMANGLSCLTSMASNMEKRKVLIAGSMAELGEQSESLHIQLGHRIVSEGVQLILAVGPYADHMLLGAADKGGHTSFMHAFKKTEQLCDNLHKWIHPDDIILVKGSRSANLEKVIQRLRELFGDY